jgi:hypothetical protein
MHSLAKTRVLQCVARNDVFDAVAADLAQRPASWLVVKAIQACIANRLRTACTAMPRSRGVVAARN